MLAIIHLHQTFGIRAIRLVRIRNEKQSPRKLLRKLPAQLSLPLDPPSTVERRRRDYWTSTGRGSEGGS